MRVWYSDLSLAFDHELMFSSRKRTFKAKSSEFSDQLAPGDIVGHF